jgi:hypothetical protein
MASPLRASLLTAMGQGGKTACFFGDPSPGKDVK